MKPSLAATLVIIPCVAGAQALVTERTISATAAQEAARTALDQCRKEGHRVTVTVLDHAARTKVVLRDDGAADAKCAQAGIDRIAAGLGS